MSITVRLWSNEDLQKILNAEDDKLATILANGNTIPANARRAYNHAMWMTNLYCVQFRDDSEVSVRATGEDTLKWFLEQEFHTEMISQIVKVVTTYETIEIDFEN